MPLRLSIVRNGRGTCSVVTVVIRAEKAKLARQFGDAMLLMIQCSVIV
jgi:hypothetical protein